MSMTGHKLSFSALCGVMIVCTAPAAHAANVWQSKPTSDENIPMELSLLRNEIEQVKQFWRTKDSSESQWQEATAAQSTQSQKWFPTLSVQGSLTRDKTDLFEASVTAKNGLPTTQGRYGITARQNLFAGGTDSKKQTISATKAEIAYLRFISNQRSMIRQWLKDLLQIQYYSDLLKFSEEAQQQATQLNLLARRKEASGFLGKRDLLESEREIIRTQRDTQSNKDKLAEVKMLHALNYGIQNPDQIKKSQIAPLLTFADQFLSMEPENFYQRASSQIINLSIAQLERTLAEEDLGLVKSNRLSPRIDATASASEAKILSTEPSSAPTADRSRSWSIGLTGEIVINPPATFGAVSESTARLTSAKAEEEKLKKNIEKSFIWAMQQLRRISEQKTSIGQLVAATTKLRQQNQRLFEAGEISLDRLILSQQELDRDRKALVTAENEENALRIEIALAERWKIAPTFGSAAVAP